MRLALDTNRYTDLARGLEPTLGLVATADAVFLPFVVVGELRAGFAVGQHTTDNERMLRRFLQKPGTDVLFADEQTTFHYASLFALLRRQGTPIPTNDLWIAALVRQHGLVLHARDKHFDHLSEIPRV
ncbi:MAG TPA: type II toxin-antitoxin system VapC family toxin [Vicinamibacterales bacterium]|nr:type II toxin-antitoxin system VapC family toxin [Vicinamibacterales bacterium]